MIHFENVMSVKEAADIWGLNPTTVKHLCSGLSGNPPRLTNTECRKSGGVWLVTRAGMTRLYGEPKTNKLKHENKV